MSEPLWQTAIVEFAATGFGVLAALGLEHWWSGRNFKKRLDEITPYIYMELAARARPQTQTQTHSPSGPPPLSFSI